MADDPVLVREFIEKFDQYGNREAPFWVVGPEEAGVEVIGDFSARLAAWDRLGRPAVVDAAEFHTLIGLRELFEGHKARTQRTWRALIWLLLAIRGIEPTPAAVWQYQRDKLGRKGGDEWLTELYSLPSPSEVDWVYRPLATIPGLEFLAERETYKAHCGPMKMRRLANALNTGSRPRAVLFYGRGHASAWNEIAGVRIEEDIGTGALYAIDRGTLFVSAHHPNFKWGSAYWKNTGLRMRELLNGAHETE